MRQLHALSRPAQTIAIVCFGFAADRVRRQPWHVAHGLATGCAALGHQVRVLTDATDPAPGEGYEVEAVPALFSRGRPDGSLRAALARLAPGRIFLICGALRLARLDVLDLGAPVTLVMTSPRVRWLELARLPPAVWWHEWRVLRGPLLDALVPGALLQRGYRRSGAAEIVYLSHAARSRYGALGLPRGWLMAPQVEPTGLPLPRRAGRPQIAYLGPALELRGAWLALRSFEAATAQGLDAELLLLLRPDSGRASLRRLLARVRRSPCRSRIRCTTRMLEPAELRRRLAGAQVFLLPFRVPVSEVPLVVIEAGLSGRPVVTLEAPGVAEYARLFGGLVAETPAALPRLLMRACLMRPCGQPDPAPWTRWDRAVEALVARPPHPLAGCRLVGLVGVDGSGKTYLADHLCDRLDEEGILWRRVWSRFRNYLSKPLLALTRLTGHNRKVEQDGVRIGYHDFQASRPLALVFLALQAVDQVLDILIRYRLRRGCGLIVGDRCVFDTLVDLAVDTGLDRLVIERLGPLLVRLLPRPWHVVVVSRPVALIRESRPDALLDRHFLRRRALYLRLARRFGLPVVENAGTAEAAIADILLLRHRRPAPAGARP